MAECIGQTTEPILRLEVGVHNAGIWGIAIDSSNRILVTGSEDKTVRVWDISGRGTCCASFGPCRRGRGGQIFTVALSPDGRTVACGAEPARLNRAIRVCTVRSSYWCSHSPAWGIARIRPAPCIHSRWTFSRSCDRQRGQGNLGMKIFDCRIIL